MSHTIRFTKVLAFIFLIGFTFGFNGQSNAQDQIEWYDGIIKIKLTPEGKQSLNLTKSGDVQLTGIASLDAISSQMNVREMTPVFVTDPRFAERHQRHGLDRWFQVTFDASADEATVASLFALDAYVEVAERVYKRYLVGNELNRENLNTLLNFDDPRLGEQWHYNNTGQTGGTPGADINLYSAWSQTTGSQDIIVKVMDSGIDLNHPDLIESLWQNPNSGPENGFNGDLHGWNFVTNTNNVQDQNNHGTHTAGTIAARSNNGIGVAGIAGGDENGPGVQIMVARVFSGTGDTPGGFPQGFVYGADNGAVISNNSWGGGGFSQVLNDAITYFIENAGYDAQGNPVGPVQGGVVFFAAGNGNTSTPTQPIASNPDVVAVAAVNHEDKKSWYSHFGSWVHMAAPGGETFVTNDPMGVLSTAIGGYRNFQGTSMASPHAAGVAALIASKFPGLTNEEIIERMIFSADEIDDVNPGFVGQLGVRINAGRALEEDDGVPPSTISNLATFGLPAENAITLTWTAPGSSGNEGQAFSYDVRYSTSPINASNFDQATQVTSVPRPAPAGSVERLEVTGLSPLTTYYFALKARDLYANFSEISNVVSQATDGSPKIALSATQFSAEVEIGETEEQTLTITNTGEGLLSFVFPSFVTSQVLNSENLEPLRSFVNVAMTSAEFRAMQDRVTLQRYETGELTQPSATQRQVIDQMLFERSLEASNNPFLLSDNSVVLEFEGLTASGGEFFDVTGDGYTGELTSVVADFVINSSAGNTWANDFAVLFTNAPEINTSTVVLQVGGLTNYGPAGTRIAWGMGGNGSAGTPVNTTIQIPTPLDVEDLYVWIGHGWTPGGQSSWSGTIELVGISDSPAFISSIQPAAATIPVGESQEVTITFDATNIVAGVYEAKTTLRSNDLTKPSQILDFFLQTAGGSPELVASVEGLSFGNVFRGNERTLSVSVTNTGTALAQIDAVSIDEPAFTVTPSDGFILSPGTSRVLEVTFAPAVVGTFNGTLSFSGNADAQVSLSGAGTEVPQIALDPEMVTLALAGGQSGQVSFSIVNEGDGPLEFTIPSFADAALSSRGLQRAPAALDQTMADQVAARTLGLATEQEHAADIAPTPRTGDSVLIEFENLTASGGEFTLVNEANYSGELSAVVADFVINSATGSTWANDFAVLFTNAAEISSSTVVLQVGGLTNYGPTGTRIPWGTGSNGAAGTPVNTTIAIPTPLDMDGIYVWIGHGWTPGGVSSWTGSVELMDVRDTPAFITGASPASGVVEAGSSQTVELTFNAEGYLGGLYEAELGIASNDPSNPLVNLLAVMEVTGSVGIVVTPQQVDFGSAFEGQTLSANVSVSNTGNGVLQVSSITTDAADFSAGESSLTVAPFSTVTLPLSFTPSSVGAQTATLTLESNDEANPVVTVALSGAGVDTPQLSVSPESINAALNTGETTQKVVTITNTGAGVLEFALPAYATTQVLTWENTRALAHHTQLEITTAMLEQVYARVAGTAQVEDSSAQGEPLSAESSVLIAFEGLTASGGTFFQVNDGDYSGALTAVDADFVINSATGNTWANDFAVLFTNAPEITTSTVVLQVGGLTNYGPAGTRIAWGMGGNGAPGTPVNTTIAIPTPLDMDGIYVWIGHGWTPGGESSWTGSVELLGVSDTPGFITDASPASGTLTPGESQDVTLTLDASGLFGGLYEAELLIVSNDPLAQEYLLPVSLDVTGVPVLEVSAEAIDFGMIFTGTTATAGLTLTNAGTDVLVLSSIDAGQGAFAVDASQAELAIGASLNVTVSFAPETAGSFTGAVAISSNAPASPQVSVALSGQAQLPPVIALDADSFSWELNSGDATTATLTISNTGASELVVNLSDVSGVPAGVAKGNVAGEGSIGKPVQASQTKAIPAAKSTEPAAVVASGSELLTEGLEVIFADNFESYDNFSLSFGPWILVDADGAATYGFQGISFPNSGSEMAAIIFNPAATSPPLTSADGAPMPGMTKYAASFASIPGSGVTRNDDWIITPQLQMGVGSVVAFYAKTFVPDYGLERFRVGVSTTGTNPEDFTIISSGAYETAPASAWTEFVYDLSAWDGQQIHIAINVVSEDAFIFMLDDFRVLAESLVSWLSYTPAELVIPAGSSAQVTIQVDADNLPAGVYERTLVVRSNDPQQPEVLVPLSLSVTEVQALSWANLQWPPTHTMEQGQEFTIYGRVYGQEVTDGDEPHDELMFWVGFHSQNTHPGTWPAEVWVEGHYNTNYGDAAEYMATTGADLSVGTWYYATAFRYANHPTVFGGYHVDGGGFWEAGVNVSGVLTVEQGTNIGAPEMDLPLTMVLDQNYPNPFNPTTQIRYGLPEAGQVELVVYNLMGQRVATLVSEPQQAGFHTVSFDASRLASGVYIYRLRAGSHTELRKMTLIK